MDRIITLIDMDCFFCQVEIRLNPSLEGLPVAVIQYNSFKRGGIVAVSYEARNCGVTRFMQKEEAVKQCPELILVSVPSRNDRADLSRYRDAGREVVDVICQFSNNVERASVDEAYVDLTTLVEERHNYSSLDNLKNTYIVGYSSNTSNNEIERNEGVKTWLADIQSINNSASQKLAVGAVIVEEIREAIFQKTGFRCSAGIAHNKVLAKLACGFHKPNKQTVLPQESVEVLFETLSVKRIRNLGGKLGHHITENLGCSVMKDLLKFTKEDLQKKYDEKIGNWLYNIARGYDFEDVTIRLLPKSIGCCKKFPGLTALVNDRDINYWLNKMGEDLYRRLLEDEARNRRRAQLLTVSMRLRMEKEVFATSKSASLVYNLERIISSSYNLLKKGCHLKPDSENWPSPLVYLSLSASKFTESNTNTINDFFKPIHLLPHEKLQTVKNNNGNISDIDLENNSLSKMRKDAFFGSTLSHEISEFEEKRQTLNSLPIAQLDCSSNMAKGEIMEKALRERNYSMPAVQDKNDCGSQNNKELLENKYQQSVYESRRTPLRRTLSSFFSDSSRSSWVTPEELFPNVDEIDHELLNFLPHSYRNRINILFEERHKKSISSASGKSMVRFDESNDGCSAADINTVEPESSHSDCKNILEPSSINSGSSISDTDYLETQCSECFIKVPVLEYEVHMDMHAAMKLDKELNSPCTQRASFISDKSSRSSLKRKKKFFCNKFSSDKGSKNLKLDKFLK